MTPTAGVLRLIGAISLTAVVASGLTAGPDDAPANAGRYRSETRRVAPGVSLTRMVDRRGPNRISVLRVDLSRTTVDVALAKNALPGLQTTSSMARQKGAVAAINGDYFLTHGHAWMGRPVNTYAEDAELMASPMIWGRNVATTQDEGESHFGHFPLRLSLTEYDTGRIHRIKEWNGEAPSNRTLSGFTSAGGSAITPPRNTCAVRLYPASERQWHPETEGVVQDLTVEKARCASEAMPRRGGIVVAGSIAGTTGLTLVQSLLPGETVRLTWSIGFPKVLDTLGGNPLLMQDGRLAVGPCDGASFCARHPRTGVGVTEGGRLLLVVVDGRWKKRSVGMTPAQFARLFRYLGAHDAINLDGGGSSTMWVRGDIVNRPSDGHERKVGNALMVLAFTDAQEPPMASSPPPTPPPYIPPTPSSSPSPTPSGLLGELPLPPPVSTRASACLAAADPASIGGYLAYVARRRGVSIAPPLRRTLAAFNGSTGIERCL